MFCFRNTVQIVNCLLEATEGCNPIQTSALWAELQTAAKQQQTPERCLMNMHSNYTFATPVLLCITEFSDHMSNFVRNSSYGRLNFLM